MPIDETKLEQLNQAIDQATAAVDKAHRYLKSFMVGRRTLKLR